MPFFENSQNVDASHGIFNDVKGNQHNAWNVTETHNIASGNTTSQQILGSYNSGGKNPNGGYTTSGLIHSNGLPLMIGMHAPVSNPDISKNSLHPPVFMHSVSAPPEFPPLLPQPPTARNSPSPSLRSTPDLVPSSDSASHHVQSSPSASTQSDYSGRSLTPATQDVSTPNVQHLHPSAALSPAHPSPSSLQPQISTHSGYPSAVSQRSPSSSVMEPSAGEGPTTRPVRPQRRVRKILSILLCR